MRLRKEHKRHSRKVTNTERWKLLRLKVLERDGWKCRVCGTWKRLEVDHIKPVRTHPELSFDMNNLQALCGRHHAAKTRVEVGHKPLPPERQKWRDLVREMRADEQKGKIHA